VSRLVLSGLALPPALWAQTSAILSVAPPGRVMAKRSGVVEARIEVRLAPGYHVNSNTPAEDYLIPLRLTWGKGPLEPVEVIYPAARMEKYEFSPKPLSVFTGDFAVVTKFRAAPGAAAGMNVIAGKLRYQACTKKVCYPPRTVEVTLPVDLR